MEDLYGAVSFPTTKILSVFVNATVSDVLPKCKTLTNALKNQNEKNDGEGKEENERNVELFELCKDQIKKCVCLFADLLAKEIKNNRVLEESRYWLFDRITWCLDKVEQIKSNMGILEIPVGVQKSPLTKSTMNLNLFIKDDFISWIDDALNILDEFEQLFADESDALLIRCQNTTRKNQWIKECLSGLMSFHRILRELIFSAMSICQNCLKCDQRIINARCHVVLRESKSLISEIVVDSELIVTDSDEIEFSSLIIKDNLHFSTIKLFINIVKEAINTLEACINRSVLALVLKCLSDPLKPLQKIILTKDENDTEKKALLKDFDMHSEQIMQIGLFAISCSADKQRVLELKSCLASLEILDVHLLPTVLSSPKSLHAQFLIDHWTQEMNVLRNCVFLIVDPVAFIEVWELVVELYQEKFNELKSESPLKWSSAQSLVELGRCVLDYFNTYFHCEPHLFQQIEILRAIIENIKKAVKECKVVSDLFLMKPNMSEIGGNLKRETYQEQRVLKRFKLLYCLLMKIIKELVNEAQTLDDEDENTSQTYVKSNNPQKSDTKRKGIFKIFDKFTLPHKNNVDDMTFVKENFANMHKNNFSRTTIMRSTQPKPKRIPCSASYKNIKERMEYRSGDKVDDSLKDFISVSGILDGIDDFILSDISKCPDKTRSTTNMLSVFNGESPKSRNSVFYGSKGFKNRQASLRRRALLNQMCSTGKKVSNPLKKMENLHIDKTFESFDESLNLHITEILESLDKVSDTISLMQLDCLNDDKRRKSKDLNHLENAKDERKSNVLTLKINESNRMSPKKVWNIRVSQDKMNDSVPERVKNIRAMPDKENVLNPDVSKQQKKLTSSSDCVDCEIDLSFGSDIPTAERLKDLEQLEMKVEYLKHFWRK